MMLNHGSDTEAQVFFYEHEFYVLSNFSAFKVRWEARIFDTSEAAYHWEKFRDHPKLQRMIREAFSAHEALQIAKENATLRRSDWDAVKVDVMRDILRAKVAQHLYVRKKLLQTGSRELVEDSWRDDFWGWGPTRTGQNMMGLLWMQIRDEEQRRGRG